MARVGSRLFAARRSYSAHRAPTPEACAAGMVGAALAQAGRERRPLCVLLTFDALPSCARQRTELSRASVQRRMAGIDLLVIDVTRVIDALGHLHASRLPEMVFYFSDGDEALRLRGFHPAEHLDAPIDEVLRREQARRSAALRPPA